MKALIATVVVSLALMQGACAQIGKETDKSALVQRNAGPTTKGKFDKALVEANNAFALDLYAKFRGQEGNLFFSPFSISTVLSMTYAGARERTGKQMASALHFTLDQQRLHPAFAALINQLNGNDDPRGYRLSIANALWGQKGYDILETFKNTNKENYGAGLGELDFATAPEQARKTINSWIERQTQEKIKDLIKPNDLDASTVLVLTNAIYFKGDWASQFKKEQTKEAPFAVRPNEKVLVPMMNQEGLFKYMNDGDFQALELPYAGNDLSMIVFLPKMAEGLAEFEKSLTIEKLAMWLPKLSRQEVDIALPKFKLISEFELNQVLIEMGMADAFDSRLADLSSINGSRGLYISLVAHKAYVEVNEEGTEAAAASGVLVPSSLPPQFHADHPFVFLIKDNRSDSILFLGRVVNPEA
jgi:serine protease inhibitor